MRQLLEIERRIFEAEQAMAERGELDGDVFSSSGGEGMAIAAAAKTTTTLPLVLLHSTRKWRGHEEVPHLKVERDRANWDKRRVGAL